MNFTKRQKLLIEFVRHAHGSQKRKYTFEPYVEHPIAVAEIVAYYNVDCIEGALCHDLFEDTNITPQYLFEQLMYFKYTVEEAREIVKITEELTDVFTKEKFPYLNRKLRKMLEALRLGTISNKAQTIKLADMIENTESIIKHDLKFAVVYLPEKREIILKLKDCNLDLKERANKVLEEAEKELWEEKH